MILSIASGKGGTGKTTVAVNLALSMPGPIRLVDCDVEEPNCQLFLHSEIYRHEDVTVPMPVVDEDKCTSCGECGRICQFNAIVSLGTAPLVFPELCHGCGGCAKVCPTGAIVEKEREIGTLEWGRLGSVELVQGRLKIGEAMASPLIRAAKKQTGSGELTIVDSPPGTSCPVIAAVTGSDFVILVTEPTPFGLHDLKIAVETIRELRLPFGIVINRCDAGDRRLLDYCRDQRLSVLLQIPDDRRIAEAYSRGEIIIHALPEYRESFEDLVMATEVCLGQSKDG